MTAATIVQRWGVGAVLLALLTSGSCGGCSKAQPPRDLLRGVDNKRVLEGAPGTAAPPAGLVESTVNGRELVWVANQLGKQIRIDDDVRRTLPGAPPSRSRYTVDIPDGALLTFATGIPSDRQQRQPVEFVVTVRAEGKDTRVFSQLMDPVKNPQHRRWLPGSADLSKYAGKARELIFETTAFDKDDDPRRAFWATPALTVPRSDAPLLIVYLVDTLRADHTSPYGYARDTTPHLSAFANDGVVFEQAIAHASWTKPSVAAMLTSQLPGSHRAVQLRDKLDLNLVTLPEMLQAQGFATGAAIANSVIYSSGVNFEQGFDRFTGLHGESGRPSKIVDAATVVDAALSWIDERRGFPTFAYVHTMDPHVPYTPPAPFDTKYEPHATPEHPAVDPRGDYHEPLDRDRMIARYDGEIAYGDVEFGRFVKALKDRGLYDRALIVFMADHGEEFLDHGKWLHGRSVFDELIRIPMIVKFPKNAYAGKRVPMQVQEVDVLPTVLQAAGLPVPQPPAIVGQPLQLVAEGKTSEREAVSEISHRGLVAHGIRTSRDKYIRSFSPEEGELFFDLTKDPGEKHSLFGQPETRDRVRKLKANVEVAMVPDPFRRNLRVTGSGEYTLRLKVGGWIEAVDAGGIGPSEKVEVEPERRRLFLKLRPRPDSPREIAFNVRPMGAPVHFEGEHDGKPLSPADVHIAEEGYHPGAVPFELPDIEPRGEDDAPRTENIFAPPRVQPASGVSVWLTKSGREMINIDKQKCEELKALGYVGSCN